jgi:hypothetical protein
VASGEKAGRMHEMPRAATYAIIKKNSAVQTRNFMRPSGFSPEASNKYI